MMEWDRWFQGKTFTTDWSSGNFVHWARILDRFRDRETRVLEIGSWEGRSAVFFLELLQKSRITCIDTFTGGPEYSGLEDAVASIEDRFDVNLASYGDRVRKMKSRSVPALDQLGQDNEIFDVVYIDGSHARDDVLMDSILAWRLLTPNGICMWDDYTWGLPDVPSARRPQHAIDAFLDLHSDELQVLETSGQVMVEKRPGGRAQRENLFTFPRTMGNLMRFLRRQRMHL
jgi:predicted O-methyltransferase YrrM